MWAEALSLRGAAADGAPAPAAAIGGVGGGAGLRRQLTKMGRLTLHSETAEAPSVPVMLLRVRGSGAPDLDALRSKLDEHLVRKQPRFRSRVDAGGDWFEELPRFEAADAVRAAPPPADAADARARVAAALSSPLRRDRPLWDALVWRDEVC